MLLSSSSETTEQNDRRRSSSSFSDEPGQQQHARNLSFGAAISYVCSSSCGLYLLLGLDCDEAAERSLLLCFFAAVIVMGVRFLCAKEDRDRAISRDACRHRLMTTHRSTATAQRENSAAGAAQPVRVEARTAWCYFFACWQAVSPRIFPSLRSLCLPDNSNAGNGNNNDRDSGDGGYKEEGRQQPDNNKKKEEPY